MASSTLFISKDCWDDGHMTLRHTVLRNIWARAVLLYPLQESLLDPQQIHLHSCLGAFQALKPNGTNCLETMPLSPKQVGCMKTAYWKQFLDDWTPKLCLGIVQESTRWVGQVHAQDCCVHVLLSGNVLELAQIYQPRHSHWVWLQHCSWSDLLLPFRSPVVWSDACKSEWLDAHWLQWTLAQTHSSLGFQMSLICRCMQAGKYQKVTFAPDRNN